MTGDTWGVVKFLSVTASHHDLDLADLEHLSLAADQVVAGVRAECVAVTGIVVLATCNRFELYLETLEPVTGSEARAHDGIVTDIAQVLTDELSAISGLSCDEVGDALRIRTGDDVVTHLFEVSAGLDSMIVGEREIAGQVRRALERARSAGTTSSGLEQVFQRASRVSRQVETTTGLGASGRSVVGVGLDLVDDDEFDWVRARTLLIGTGSYAGATLAALRSRGADDVRVFSQSGRAEDFAAPRGAQAVRLDELEDALADVDVLVACSGNLGGFVDAAMLRAARARGAGSRAVSRPLIILDLALRRDVAHDVAELEQVRVLDLAAIQQHAPSAALEPVARARALIETATADFRADTVAREHRARKHGARKPGARAYSV